MRPTDPVLEAERRLLELVLKALWEAQMYARFAGCPALSKKVNSAVKIAERAHLDMQQRRQQ